MFRYTPTTLQKLEHLFREADYTIRYEKGTFKPGYCIIKDKKVAVINKYFDTEARINALIDILSEMELDESLISEKSKELLQQVKDSRISA